MKAKLLIPYLQQENMVNNNTIFADLGNMENSTKALGNMMQLAIDEYQNKNRQIFNQFYQPPQQLNNNTNENNNQTNQNMQLQQQQSKSKPRPADLINIGCGCSRGGAPCVTRSCRCRKADTGCIYTCKCVDVCCNPMGVHP
jgi:hypothetical protein